MLSASEASAVAAACPPLDPPSADPSPVVSLAADSSPAAPPLPAVPLLAAPADALPADPLPEAPLPADPVEPLLVVPPPVWDGPDCELVPGVPVVAGAVVAGDEGAAGAVVGCGAGDGEPVTGCGRVEAGAFLPGEAAAQDGFGVGSSTITGRFCSVISAGPGAAVLVVPVWAGEDDGEGVGPATAASAVGVAPPVPGVPAVPEVPVGPVPPAEPVLPEPAVPVVLPGLAVGSGMSARAAGWHLRPVLDVETERPVAGAIPGITVRGAPEEPAAGVPLAGAGPAGRPPARTLEPTAASAPRNGPAASAATRATVMPAAATAGRENRPRPVAACPRRREMARRGEKDSQVQ